MESPPIEPDKDESPACCWECVAVYIILAIIVAAGIAAQVFFARMHRMDPTPQPGTKVSVYESAVDYTRRGWRVIPVPYQKKEAEFKGWVQTNLEEKDLSRYFPPGQNSNIAVKTGEPSGGLLDVDLDHSMAVELADLFLPPTPAVFGRPGKPRSHRLYQAAGTIPLNKRHEIKDAKTCILEIRSTNLLSNVPPSVHPSGENITWDEPGAAPAVIDIYDLAACVQALAEAVCDRLGVALKQDFPVEYGPRPKATLPKPGTDDIAMADRVKRATKYISRMPDAVSGAGGHNATFAAACECFRFGLDDASVESVMEWFNQTKTGGEFWSAKDLHHKINSARSKMAGQFGSRLLTDHWHRPRTGNRPTPGVAGGSTPQTPADGAPPVDSGGDELGTFDSDSGQLILSPVKTLPTADAFIKNFYSHPDGPTIVSFGGSLMVWERNRYRAIEDAGVRSTILPWLHGAAMRDENPKSKRFGALVPFNANPFTVRDALLSVHDRAHIPSSTPLPSWLVVGEHAPDPRNLLAFPSGTVDVETGLIIAPTPNFFTTNAITFDYQENPPTPENWFTFLHQLWGDDEESIQMLREWIGLCLVSDTRYQKSLLLVGPPRAGKGMIGRVIKSLVGEENVCGPTTASLADQFGLQQLMGKTLAIVSDARFTGEHISLITERLLCIIGEDPISVDRKYQNAITLRLPTRFMFITNEIPRLNDSSSALTKRFITLQLTNSFYGKEDTGLFARLEAELPGILKWAMEGLHSLRERGRFHAPASTAEAIQDLEDLGSPVGAFVRECCELGQGEGFRAFITDLYEAWKKWSEREGRSYTVTKQMFGRDLVAAVPSVRSRRGTGNDRFYEGIALKTASLY